jgi:hypothetical protein
MSDKEKSFITLEISVNYNYKINFFLVTDALEQKTRAFVHWEAYQPSLFLNGKAYS